MQTSKLQLGIGFQFKPTDEELVKYFLLRKVRGEALSPNPIIVDCDLYGNKSPWEIFEDGNKTLWYCFSTLKKTSKRRISRVAGCGTWHGETCAKEIVDSNTNDVIGYKKTFTFKTKGKKSDWIMYEFTMADLGEDNYAVCKIKKKNAKAVVHNHKITLEEEEGCVVCETMRFMGTYHQTERKAIPYNKQLSREMLLAANAEMGERNNTSALSTLQYRMKTQKEIEVIDGVDFTSDPKMEEWLRSLEKFFISDNDVTDTTLDLDDWSSIINEEYLLSG